MINTLNPEQRIAATHGEGPLLILAGAGTGKTRVITARIAWLIAQGQDAAKILAVTFTNKAAREMKERVAKAIPAAEAKKVTVSTFHSLCVRILRQHAHHLGYKSNFTILDEGDQIGIIRKQLGKVSSRDEKLDPNVARALISKAKNNAWAPPSDEVTLLGSVYRRYEQELRTLNAMDFDDLLVNAVRLLRDHVAARTSCQERFQWMMVDEFQDTNRLQLELVSLLAGSRQNVCVVGDDDQSIYGWRGAEVSNILEFERHFPEPRIVKLERNYRSATSILETANRLIRNNPKRRVKNLRSEIGAGEAVRLLALPNDLEEAEFVAGEIAERLAGKRWKHEDFAVLFRMNAQSRAIEEAFRKYRLPYRVVGGKSYFERREVKDVLAFARFLVNPHDDPSLLRMLSAVPRGIGPTTIEIAIEQSASDRKPLYTMFASEAFRSSLASRTRSAIEALVAETDHWRSRIDAQPSRPSSLFRDYVEQSGYLDELQRTCKTEDEALNRSENVREALRALEQYEQRAADGLSGFVDEMSLDDHRDEKEELNFGVTLITLHAAKGLEFPHVYLVGVEDSILPHERSKTEGTVDEERRLLYVGITRAMRTLTLSHCLQRTKYGRPIHCRPSPFLKELEGEGVRWEDYQELREKPPESEEQAAGLFARMRAGVQRG